ncbi:hypothetical protein [Nocardia sp. NPDC051832]|uniref:hypothetical protein n=1 Tax=Nocardia sp. NPDC051832 TaxID=3155673 RepID=UPI00343469D0
MNHTTLRDSAPLIGGPHAMLSAVGSCRNPVQVADERRSAVGLRRYLDALFGEWRAVVGALESHCGRMLFEVRAAGCSAVGAVCVQLGPVAQVRRGVGV